MPVLARNKRARFDYEILETIEGGLKLTGAEVKSAKAGSVQLKGSFLFIKNEELWLKNTFIAKYKPAGTQDSYDPYRDRKVLVHKKELRKLIGKSRAEGLTIVPLSIYTRQNIVKLEFASARGKKLHEKRESIKKREANRQIHRMMKE